MPQIWNQLAAMTDESSRPVFCLVVALVLGSISLVQLIRWMSSPLKGHNLPVFQVTSPEGIVGVLEEAHQECGESPFLLSMPGMDVAVLPACEIDTIKALPETDVSIKKHHYKVFLGEYTYMGTKADEFDQAMRHVLARNTSAMLSSFTAEIEYAVNDSIGECREWTAVIPKRASSRIASLLSGRAFVGLPLSRDSDWVEATINYTGDVSRAWMALAPLPKPIRFLLAPWLPQVKSLKRQRTINEEKIATLLKAKQDTRIAEKKELPGGDVMGWFAAQYSTEPTVKELSRDQLLATFASIYNLSNALTYVIFDLAAAEPSCVEQMRAELLEHVGVDGIITMMNLPRLRKLDSFVKESQRLCPPSLLNIPRIVTRPQGLKLSTGHILPRGMSLTISSHAINLNPKLYPAPTKFDAFRFSRLREIPGNELKYQHASTGIDSINFGHGIWACPGRFFASAEIKVMLAYLLTHYDVKLKPGEEKPSQQYFGLAILPNPTAEVLFKRRNVA